MTAADLRAQMAKFRVRRSVLGRRVRLIDRVDGCIEYARLSKVPGKSVQFFQRVDGLCSGRARMPKFPDAMAARELPGGASLPYFVSVRRPNYAEVNDGNQCATYKRSRQGVWLKVSETCRETMHDKEVDEQRYKHLFLNK